MRNEKFCSQLITSFKSKWDLAARGVRAREISDCVEGSWRDFNHERKYPRLASIWTKETEEEIAAVICFYLFPSTLTVLLNLPFICFLSFFVF
jgi:hypothetical protein